MPHPILFCVQPAAGEPDESAALRKELLSDVRELRRLLDGYMSQLATLTGSDVEAAMKKGLEAVDQLDAAVTLEKVGLHFRLAVCW